MRGLSGLFAAASVVVWEWQIRVNVTGRPKLITVKRRETNPTANVLRSISLRRTLPKE